MKNKKISVITFVGCLMAVMVCGTGCVNLSKDLVLPVSMLKPTQTTTTPPPANPTTKAEIAFDAIQEPSMILVKTAAQGGGERTAEFESAADVNVTPVTGYYSGLELLNRAAGNGRSSHSVLSRAGDDQITSFQRAFMTRSSDSTAHARRIVIHYTDYAAPLSPAFLKNSSVKNVLAATREDVTGEGTGSESVSLMNSKSLARAVARSVSIIHDDPSRQSDMLQSLQSIYHAATNSSSTKTIDIRLDTIAFAYMQAYLEGNFVDRDGTKISQPDISSKLGNDTVTSFEKVLLEAVYDYATMTPIVHEPESAKPSDLDNEGKSGADATTASSSLKPTFVVLFPDFYEEVSTDTDARGVTEAEMKLMTFFRGIGGEQSKHLSSIIIRFLGGAAVGAKLSVGDNDTLSKAVSTLCEQFVAGTTDTICYNFFEKFQYTVDSDGNYISDADANKRNLGLTKEVGDAIAKALQYEDLLSSLVKTSTSQPSK
jgi:hypothetical protein